MMKFLAILSFALIIVSIFYSLDDRFAYGNRSSHIIHAQEANEFEVTALAPTVTPPQLGTITKFCLGEGSDGNHKTATTLCLPWDKQISTPISGVGKSAGEHYCCELCKQNTDSWANTCYRPIDKNKNTRGPNETTCETNAGVAFPLKCKTDPTDNVFKWISQNDVGECNTICSIANSSNYTLPNNTPTPSVQPTNTPTPTPQNGSSCTLTNQSPAIMQKCVDCIYSLRDDLKRLKPANCTANQIVQHWCNGGISTGAVEDCKNMKTDTAKCGASDKECNLIPSATPSPTSSPTPAQLNCEKVDKTLFTEKCASCINTAFGDAPEKVNSGNNCNISQKVINFCRINTETKAQCVVHFATCAKETNNNCTALDGIFLFSSYSNKEFETVMDYYKQGQLDAISVSKYVAQASRVPGIQMRYCNPYKGECSLLIESLL